MPSNSGADPAAEPAKNSKTKDGKLDAWLTVVRRAANMYEYMLALENLTAMVWSLGDIPGTFHGLSSPP